MKEFVCQLLAASQSSRVRISSNNARGTTPDKSQPQQATASTASGTHQLSSAASTSSSGGVNTPSQSPRPAVAELQLPAGFSALEEELLASVAQLVRLVVHNRAVYVEHYVAIVDEELARLRAQPQPTAPAATN